MIVSDEHTVYKHERKIRNHRSFIRVIDRSTLEARIERVEDTDLLRARSSTFKW
jgi:hypothetical protein